MAIFRRCLIKKILSIKCQWYIIVIISCIFLFSLLCWISFGKNIKTALSSRVKPDLIDYHEEKGIDYDIDEFDKVWCDSIIKKSFLSKIDTIFTFYTTGEISSSQVVCGSNNWLFYKSLTDDNPIGDFEGTNRYTEDEMNEILGNALFTQEEIENRGIEFAIFVAPNKENVYSEFMPEKYIHEKISSTDILIDYLYKNGINIVTPKEELLEKHLDMQLYYTYDTHWNQLGAYIGVKKILDFWDISMAELPERNILSGNLRDNYHYCGEDDLAKMVGLRTIKFNDEIEYEIDGTGLMNWNKFEEEQKNNEVSYFSNPDATVRASVLLVGDSFKSSMVPALREMYTEVYVTSRARGTLELLDQIKPDYLILEYVERYSRSIVDIDALVR